jgi:hypothetical protein
MTKSKILKECYNIPGGGNMVLEKGIIRVFCSKGTIWATWPWSGDILLKKGDSLLIKSAGKICFNAFEDSDLDIEISDSLKYSRIQRNRKSLMKYTRLIMEK